MTAAEVAAYNRGLQTMRDLLEQVATAIDRTATGEPYARHPLAKRARVTELLRLIGDEAQALMIESGPNKYGD